MLMNIGKAELIVLTLVVAGLAFVIARRRREGLGRTPLAVPAERRAADEVLGRDWRDRVLIPVAIAVASGVITAIVLALLGLRG
jgi:hypothetical protein